MRLLNAKTLQLRESSGCPGETPQYAILSHCWREEEVLFQDIQDLDRARGMAGFPKIEHCCKQAREIGYEWVWADTCCIDKLSSAELSEAINSMFKWYGNAGTCLVYLDDVDHGDPHAPDSLFRKSRWFTRGWTLQELLAPKRLVFFSKSWSFLDTNGSLLTLLSIITKIPADALSHTSSLSLFSIAQRMSWAAKRQTTRLEDRAYSLMGLFGIFMPIIYEKAVLHSDDFNSRSSSARATRPSLLGLTNQAFSVFIGHSLHSLGTLYPRVSIDVAFYRPEEFSTLEARKISDEYDHHHYHKHFCAPSDVTVYEEGTDDSWIKFKCDDTDDRPGLIRYCECECKRHQRKDTTTQIFGNHKRGLLVTTTVWDEFNAEENLTYCTVWVELSLLGSIYSGGSEDCDELDARSDVAEWGSVHSDGEAECEDGSLPSLSF